MNRLRELRQEKKLSLAKMSKEVNISASLLGYYEREEREPKKETWEKLANYFKVSVPYIMGLTEEAFDSSFKDILQKVYQEQSSHNTIDEQLKKKMLELLNTSFNNSDNNQIEMTPGLNYLLQDTIDFLISYMQNQPYIKEEYERKLFYSFSTILNLFKRLLNSQENDSLEDFCFIINFIDSLFKGNIIYGYDFEQSEKIILSSVDTTDIFLYSKERANKIFNEKFLEVLNRYFS